MMMTYQKKAKEDWQLMKKQQQFYLRQILVNQDKTLDYNYHEYGFMGSDKFV